MTLIGPLEIIWGSLLSKLWYLEFKVSCNYLSPNSVTNPLSNACGKPPLQLSYSYSEVHSLALAHCCEPLLSYMTSLHLQYFIFKRQIWSRNRSLHELRSFGLQGTEHQLQLAWRIRTSVSLHKMQRWVDLRLGYSSCIKISARI